MSHPDLQGTYEYVFCGTGPTECMVSGCVAQTLQKVLHIDRDREYGGCRITKGINDFLAWIQTNGELLVDRVHEVLGERIRNYSIVIDMFPLVFYARDEIMNVFTNARISETLNFYLIDGLFYRAESEWRPIPSSKSSIFQEKNLSFKQKRQVMNFVSYFLPDGAYGHVVDRTAMSAKVEEFADRPFSDLIANLGLGAELGGAFEHSVAFVAVPSLTRDVVPKIKQFCESLGRYGTSAFLANAYGASDVPQGFARYSAIYGGTFVLDHPPNAIRKADDGLLEIDVPGIGIVRTKHFVTEPGALPTTGERRLLGYREVLLLSSPLLREDRAIGAVAPGVLGNERPIYVVQYDGVLRMCEKGMFVVHMFAMCDLKAVVDRFVSELPDGAVVMRAAWVVTEPVPAQPQEEGVIVVESPSVDDAVIGAAFFLRQAKSVLEKIAPDVPFYPAPTEEEVWIDEPAAEAPRPAKQDAAAPQGEAAAEKQQVDATAGDAPQAEAAPEPQVAPDAEAVPKPQVAPDAEAVPKPQVAPDAEAAPEAQVAPDAEAVPEAQVAPGRDGRLDADGK
jgi:Rab GDP dissociation inhibitor